MAYSFGLGNSNVISMGTGVSRSVPFTVAARVKVNSVFRTTPRRFISAYNDGGSQSFFFLFFLESVSIDNQLAFGFSKGGGTSFPIVIWASGFTAGSTHTVVGTYDGANIKLYADTDSTPKTSAAESGTPDQPSQTFMVGNSLASGGSESWDGIIYELGYWSGTALTGAQAAQFGASNPAGLPLPTNYWGLINSPIATFGGINGTVGGATVVAHAGNNVYRDTGGMLLMGVGS